MVSWSRSTTSRSLAALLLCVLLPLLAACGGSGGGPSSSQRIAAGATIAPIESSRSGVSGGTAATAATGASSGDSSAGGQPARLDPVGSTSGASAPQRDDSAALVEPNPPIAPPEGGKSIAVQPTPPPPEQSSQQSSTLLKAGEVDDNAEFAAYQAYLQGFYSPPGRPVDVSERYILTVLNDQQQPVLDARVRVFDGQTQIFEGRTYAGGKTILFPRALGASKANALRVTLEKGNSTAEGTLKRGQDTQQSFVLPGAPALPQRPKLDVMFLLDATGSMGDEIYQIQKTIVTIANRIDGFSPRPELRFGLVAYRDHGEEFVTRVYDFTPDVEAFRQLLLSVQAVGGGDEPEALNEALHASVQQVNWADDAVRLTFLVADAPPHLDYPNDYDYVQELRAAVGRGVKVYPIAASNTNDDAEYIFRQMAQQTLGHFIFLTYQPGQNAGAPGDTTQRQVDPAAFTVERLDDLVVQVVQRELASAVGKS